MNIERRTEDGPHGKVHVLEAEIDGLRFAASHVWPRSYEELVKVDALVLIDRQLWGMLMHAIEQHLKGQLSGKAKAKDSNTRH